MLVARSSPYYTHRGAKHAALEQELEHGGRMATWCFKTAALNERKASRHLWYWQIDTNDMVMFTAIKLFATLDECVEDARAQGFRGAINLPAAVSHPALITWSEDADGVSTVRIGECAA